MASIFVQQQTKKTTSPENESSLAIKHRVDEGLFFYKQDSADFLNILQRFATEPQMSHSSSQNLVGTNSVVSSSSSLFLSTNENYEKEKINVFGVDQVEAIRKEDKISDTVDNILASGMVDASDKNSMSKSYSNSRLNGKIHFQNRKRVASLIRTCQSEFGIQSCFNKTSTSFESTFGNQAQNFTSNTNISSSYTSTSSLSPKSTSSCESIAVSNPGIPTGVLRRTCRVDVKKKTVRFADSIGRELEQVKYIQSLTNDDLTDFSLFNNKLYLPKLFNLEHKPWTFDVESTSIPSPPVPIPKRFFCLYRQPNSDHPDIYLHEIWKYHIKLEYACMRLKFSLTGEQCLYGTVWVANSGYHKNVTIQYTFDRWLNKYEYEAKYCCHSNDSRNIDKFEFSIDISYDIDRVDFAVRYRVNGQENWDNNENQNYTLETESAYKPHTTISLPHDCNFDEMRFY